MIGKEKEMEIEKLTKILSTLQDLYYKKKEQLEELELEIEDLKEILSTLKLIISNKSFHRADEMYLKSIESLDLDKESDIFFTEEPPKEKIKGTKIKRKIFIKNKQEGDELACILNFFDLNTVDIKIINPEIRTIKETSEEFINLFLKGALIKLKEINEDLSLEYDYFKDTDIIEHIKIKNLKSIEDYDIITEGIKNLLSSDSFQF